MSGTLIIIGLVMAVTAFLVEPLIGLSASIALGTIGMAIIILGRLSHRS